MITDAEFARLRMEVIRLQGQVAYLYKQLNMTFVPEERPSDDPRIIEALKNGKELDAIRFHRENTGMPMPEARAAVDEIRGRLGL